jgi:transposase-like protein
VAGLKKKHFVQEEKAKAVRFLRENEHPMRKVAWLLNLSFGTLGSWNQEFNEQMQPYRKTDERGKSGKVTIEVVRQVVDEARKWKSLNRRIRIKEFTLAVNRDLQLNLGRKTVEDILTANDLWNVETRKRRPAFYRNLCRRIPNGLLSLDGSEFTVWVNDEAVKMIVELGVDAGSFCHTGFGVHETETSRAVLDVLEQHCSRWGIPLGVVFDHGSANLSDEVRQYLEARHIEIVPAGPGNPKGNGTDEGAFSQMKRTIGTIRLDTSSPIALARSVLHEVLSVYVKMRNQMSLRKTQGVTPQAHMETPVSEADRQKERERLLGHRAAKNAPDPHQPKLDRLHFIVQSHALTPEPAELKRAEHCIRYYDIKAIRRSEEAFLKAVGRDERRKNLSYFFGILRNIQKEMDNERHAEYCRQRYNYDVMLDTQRQAQQEKEDQTPTIEGIVSMAIAGISGSFESLKRMATKKCQQSIEKMVQTARYVGPIKKQILDAIGAKEDLEVTQKEKVWALIETLLNQKPQGESVTLQI